MAAGVSISASSACGLARDMSDIGPVDAYILQFAVRIAGQFVENVPVTTALFQEFANEGEFHLVLLLAF
jgi:hypothetical protein